jgi:hypothetical protein
MNRSQFEKLLAVIAAMIALTLAVMWLYYSGSPYAQLLRLACDNARMQVVPA